MTETTRSMKDPRLIGAIALFLIAAVVVLLVQHATEGMAEQRHQRSCMEKLTAPDPDDPDYNDKVLWYASDVRECMRG